MQVIGKHLLVDEFVLTRIFEICFQKMFSAEAASEKITYTHVVSKGKTEEKHYGEYSTQKMIILNYIQ